MTCPWPIHKQASIYEGRQRAEGCAPESLSPPPPPAAPGSRCTQRVSHNTGFEAQIQLCPSMISLRVRAGRTGLNETARGHWAVGLLLRKGCPQRVSAVLGISRNVGRGSRGASAPAGTLRSWSLRQVGKRERLDHKTDPRVQDPRPGSSINQLGKQGQTPWVLSAQIPSLQIKGYRLHDRGDSSSLR